MLKKPSKPPVRDPRDVARFIVECGWPLFILDENRVKPDVVIYSLVVLTGVAVPNALEGIRAVRTKHPKAAMLRAPQLMREKTLDAKLLHSELCSHLGRGQVLRIGSTYGSLKSLAKNIAYKLRWPTRADPIHSPEHLLLIETVHRAKKSLGISKNVFVLVDESQQLGMDPRQRGNCTDIVAGFVQEDSSGNPSAILVPAARETDLLGDWIRLADLDAARATTDPDFEGFVSLVRANRDRPGRLSLWPVRFPKLQSEP